MIDRRGGETRIGKDKIARSAVIINEYEDQRKQDCFLESR